MKNSSVIIGNRTRNIPACKAVPQPTAPPHALATDSRLKKNFTINDYTSKKLNNKEIISKIYISTVVVCTAVCAELTLMEKESAVS
jgi:hypothetical protein